MRTFIAGAGLLVSLLLAAHNPNLSWTVLVGIGAVLVLTRDGKKKTRGGKGRH